MSKYDPVLKHILRFFMQIKKCEKTVFENIGGSFQFHARRAEDLHKILNLDSTAWAALCVPVSSLNGDPAFFKALDGDGNAMIRVDEVKAAIQWLLALLLDVKVLNDAVDTLPATALNTENAEGKLLTDFVEQHKSDLLDENGLMNLQDIRAKLAAVTAGPLTGDGILHTKGAEKGNALNLYNDITKLNNTPDNLTLAALDKFLADAASFVEWSKTAEKPLFRDDDPVKYFDSYKAMADKLDEYFRYCELVKTDPAHAVRFELDPAKLPELNLQDPAAIDNVLKNTPLARPTAEAELDLLTISNPFFRKPAQTFAATFGCEKLSMTQWQQIKADMAPYIDYLAKAQGALAAQLGREKLEQHLAGSEIESLRQLFAEDKALAGVVDALRKLERLLLYCRYMLEFTNNFVSFDAFFDPEQTSMLQAGRLVMDGKSYHLAVWIDDIAAHKKIAVRSHLCLLYLDVTSSGPVPVKRKVAVAVTGGALTRIYVGKPAFFIDNNQITYNGKIVDMVEGPISFRQTLFAPFRRISEALGNKIQKITDFSSTEKQLTQAIETGKMPAAKPAPANVPMTQKLMNNGSMMLLAGGLSVAALGAGLSFVLKSITGAITAISALPGYVILIWIAVLLAIFLVPTAIFAFLKLRKRNLTLFLEAGGWAVNLPMRLNMQVSSLFTQGAEYPENAVFKIIKPSRRKNITVFVLLTLLVLAAAGAALWYLQKR